MSKVQTPLGRPREADRIVLVQQHLDIVFRIVDADHQRLRGRLDRRRQRQREVVAENAIHDRRLEIFDLIERQRVTINPQVGEVAILPELGERGGLNRCRLGPVERAVAVPVVLLDHERTEDLIEAQWW